MQPLVVPARFNGPPASANGGWFSGRLAALLEPGPDDAVQVVLRSPPPLEVPLQVQRGTDGGLSAWSGDTPIAAVNPVASPFTGAAPEAVSDAVARAAGAAYAGARDHPFPTCFVCGPRRDPGDGLRLAPGRVPGRSTDTAAVWVPDPSLDGGSGRVDVAACWAALDCPGGWALDLVGRPMVLGTMTAQVRKLPRIGGRYAVVGRVVRTEGRKAYTETALYDLEGLDVPLGGPVLEVATDPADGRSGASVPLARAAAVWLRVDPASIRPA